MEVGKTAIVRSVNGRDRGYLFLVVDVDAEGNLLLADGRRRRVEKPKRKKRRHVRFEASYQGRAADKLLAGERVTNSELRRVLAEFGQTPGGE